jgi:hypothetical protein
MIDRDGIVRSIAGTADISLPGGVVAGGDSAVYVADSGNNRIRRIVLSTDFTTPTTAADFYTHVLGVGARARSRTTAVWLPETVLPLHLRCWRWPAPTALALGLGAGRCQTDGRRSGLNGKSWYWLLFSRCCVSAATGCGRLKR